MLQQEGTETTNPELSGEGICRRCEVSTTNSRSASQEIPRLLWSPKVHYRVFKGPLIPPDSKSDECGPTYLFMIRFNSILP